ncbi:MAG TPA: 16S rRNA (guanine(966)-N(2))-methyltransferase RsmD [Spirochaetales bacterium]|nr:16S rRNA (guanine(966)-N(2))-methyltransferase RsmD [Spirochaetales bacterium]
MAGLRVTGGLYKGRLIEVPKGPWEIRPAMDRMRESVFGILGNLAGMSFLDLFSGSGIIALEAASRGAEHVECVERDRAKLPTLIRNMSVADQRIACHAVPVERFLKRCERSYDIVFADPPFPYEFKAQLLAMVAEQQVVAPGGLFIIHYPSENILPESAGTLTLSDEREYGRSCVRFYKSILV